MESPLGCFQVSLWYLWTPSIIKKQKIVLAYSALLLLAAKGNTQTMVMFTPRHHCLKVRIGSVDYNVHLYELCWSALTTQCNSVT